MASVPSTDATGVALVWSGWSAMVSDLWTVSPAAWGKEAEGLIKKEAPLKWEQWLEMALHAKADSKRKERGQLKAHHKSSRKEWSSESDTSSDDTEEMQKRKKKHHKHKHISSKHSQKHNHHEFGTASEDDEESGSDENQTRPLCWKRS